MLSGARWVPSRVLGGAGGVFGGVLAVGRDPDPPYEVILRRPGSGPRVVLVGKGITFDFPAACRSNPRRHDAR